MVAPRSECTPEILCGSSPRMSTLPRVAPSHWKTPTLLPGNATRLTFARSRSTSSILQSRNSTSVSCDPRRLRVRDATVGKSHLLPHAVIDNAGTDPRTGNVSVQQASAGHRPGVGAAVRDLRSGDPSSAEVDRSFDIAEVHVRHSTVEEGRLGDVRLGEVEVGELHALEEFLGTDITEEALNQMVEAELRWARRFGGHSATLTAPTDTAFHRTADADKAPPVQFHFNEPIV
jgi:hypothetical protein